MTGSSSVLKNSDCAVHPHPQPLLPQAGEGRFGAIHRDGSTSLEIDLRTELFKTRNLYGKHMLEMACVVQTG
jgi:hypothetical protein